MSTRVVAKRRGFTLTELLTVLGIVGVLVAILVTVVTRVRESGRRAVCQSNLHQISLAVRQYVQDHDGKFPSLLMVDNKNTTQAKIVRWNDVIFSYIKNRSVFECPTSQWPETWSDTDYSYNWMRLNHINWSSDKNPLKNEIEGSYEATALSVSTIWLNTDNTWQSEGEDVTDGVIIKGSCGRGAIAGNLHNGGANYSFLDGHVKWLTPEQWIEIECQNGPLPAPFKD